MDTFRTVILFGALGAGGIAAFPMAPTPAGAMQIPEAPADTREAEAAPAPPDTLDANETPAPSDTLDANETPAPSDTLDAEAAPAPDSVRAVRLSFVVEASATTATGAMSAARFRAHAVMGALGQSGIELRELAAHDPEVTQVLERRVVARGRGVPAPPRVEGYRAWIPVTVVAAAPRRADFLVDRAAGAGAYLEGIEYVMIPEEDAEETE